jgi:hypothetical protein
MDTHTADSAMGTRRAGGPQATPPEVRQTVNPALLALRRELDWISLCRARKSEGNGGAGRLFARARGRRKGAKRGVRPLIIDSWLPSSESRYGYRAMARKLSLGYLRGALSRGQLPRRPDFGLAFLVVEKMLPFDHGLRDAGAGISCPVRPETSVSAGLRRFAVSSPRPNQQSAARPHLSQAKR